MIVVETRSLLDDWNVRGHLIICVADDLALNHPSAHPKAARGVPPLLDNAKGDMVCLV